MGIVELDGDLFMQIIQVGIIAQMPPDDLVDAGADEEILLLQAQHLAMLRGVIRINVACDFLDLIDIVTQISRFDKVLCDLCVPKTQRIGHFRIVTDDRHVIWHGTHYERRDVIDYGLAILVEPHIYMSAELYVTGMLHFPHFPYVAVFQPDIRHFYLLVVFDLLLEEAILITDAVSVSGKVQGSQRIQEAGCQASQTAVAQTCVGFQFLDVVDVDVKISESFLDDVVDPQIHQIVGEQTPDQKFHGKIIHLLFLIPLDGVFCVFPVYTGIVANHFPQNNVFLSNVRFFN